MLSQGVGLPMGGKELSEQLRLEQGEEGQGVSYPEQPMGQVSLWLLVLERFGFTIRGETWQLEILAD